MTMKMCAKSISDDLENRETYQQLTLKAQNSKKNSTLFQTFLKRPTISKQLIFKLLVKSIFFRIIKLFMICYVVI
jgi:hypothetical protein